MGKRATTTTDNSGYSDAGYSGTLATLTVLFPSNGTTLYCNDWIGRHSLTVTLLLPSNSVTVSRRPCTEEGKRERREAGIEHGKSRGVRERWRTRDITETEGKTIVAGNGSWWSYLICCL